MKKWLKKRKVGLKKKVFTGSWFWLIFWFCMGFLPGIIYWLVKQGYKEYEYVYDD